MDRRNLSDLIHLLCFAWQWRLGGNGGCGRRHRWPTLQGRREVGHVLIGQGDTPQGGYGLGRQGIRWRNQIECGVLVQQF